MPDDYLWQQADLEARQQECIRILALVKPYLTEADYATLEYECGLSSNHKD